MPRKSKNQKKIPEDFLIQAPEEEYRSYVEQQIEQLTRFGEQQDKIELHREALELGLKVLGNIKGK
jgi:hypothetical protein